MVIVELSDSKFGNVSTNLERKHRSSRDSAGGLNALVQVFSYYLIILLVCTKHNIDRVTGFAYLSSKFSIQIELKTKKRRFVDKNQSSINFLINICIISWR